MCKKIALHVLMLLVLVSLAPSQSFAQYRMGHHPEGNSSDNNWLQIIPSIIEPLIEQSNRPPHHHPPHNHPQNNYYYDDDGDYYYPQQNTRPQVQVQKPVTAPKNTKPTVAAKPAAPVKPKSNGGIKQTALSLTAAEFIAAKNELLKRVDSKSDEIVTLLEAAGPLPPELQQELDVLKQSGGSLSSAEIQKLQTLVETKLPDGVLKNSLLGKIGEEKGLISIRDLVDTAVPGTGTIPITFIPTTLIQNPALPNGTIISLGNGAMIVGTGGQGTLGMTTGSLGSYLNVPVVTGKPAPETEATGIYSGVLLVNVSTTDTVSYLANKSSFDMAPTYSQTLPASTQWVVAFNRGDGAADVKYTLRDGTYEFTPTDNGWELYRKSYSVTLDNTDSGSAFNYVLNNVPASVEAGQSRTHESPYPIVVNFDRSNGTIVKRLLKRGEFKIAINQADGLWDIFKADDIQPSNEAAPAPTVVFGDSTPPAPEKSLFGAQ